MLSATLNNGAFDRCQKLAPLSTPRRHHSSGLECKRRRHLVSTRVSIEQSVACTVQRCHFKVTSSARRCKHQTAVLCPLLFAHAHISARQAATAHSCEHGGRERWRGRRFRFCGIHLLAAALRMDQTSSGTQVSAGWCLKNILIRGGATDIEWGRGRSLRNLPTSVLSSCKFIFHHRGSFWKLHSAALIQCRYENEM